ncbi:hypothetical protein KCP73_14625 [Salmonella enterica subsp. enterica]|nr:hypothetical protein KCP73_14625 [Salmonella enterica subsp. enterica]
MFTDTINKCAANAARIARLSADNPLGWVSSRQWPGLMSASVLFMLLMVICSRSFRTSSGDGGHLWYRLNAGHHRGF